MRHAGVWAAAAALAAGASLAAPLGAQGYFGQNQVQYDKFNWKVLETEHFLVHYYPEERTAAVDAARMAERSYARLSRVLGHQFREKKPIIVFASRSDFGQNNVTGDLGEGVEGVTEPLRQRNLLYFQGDYGNLQHLLTHEMVHQFQYDIFARGKAGNNLQALSQNMPPLWFAEGMAEYLSIGPDHRFTDTWIRDAAINGNLPSIEQMTERPDRFFPYRYGESLWEYVGGRWGDEVIGQIMNAVPNIGVERAIKRELGLSTEELSDEWREAMQTEHLPQVAQLERARKFSQPLLSERRSGGQIFLAPALSPDGNNIAFLSNGSFLRGEVFIDLWLANARTGKRIKRLVKSVTNPEFEELRLTFSQSAFSPDGRLLAFTGQRSGKDVLYLLDVRKRKTIRRLDFPLEAAWNPTWSPDGRRLVFSGNRGGITDLYVVDIDGKNLRQLTNDRNGDMQPSWSPDGRTIAFASERGPDTDLSVLRPGKWKISLYDMESGRVDVVPNQGGLNLNPVWAPDGKSIIFVSDRTGIQNLFLYDFDAKEHYQLTNVIGGVTAVTEFSPAITWAQRADRLAYTYFENGDYTVWSIDNPRLLKKAPYRESGEKAQPTLVAGTQGIAKGMPGLSPGGGSDVLIVRGPNDSTRALSRRLDSAATAVQAAPAAPLGDSALRQRSLYRTATGFRPSAELPDVPRNDTSVISVAALLDSAELALPDTARFKDTRYKIRFQPEYVARPSVGYAQDNFGRGVFGGTTIVLSDLLGNHRLALSGQVNGRLADAMVFAGYTNLSGRLQYSTALSQVPYFFASDQRYTPTSDPNYVTEELDLTRFVVRQGYLVALRPRNRFTRFELGAQFSNIDRTTLTAVRLRDQFGGASQFRFAGQENLSSLNYAAPFAAYVSDNTLFGYTGPIMGRRYRFQVEPTIGSLRWIEYLADYRRYDPILFNFLTVATRFTSQVRVGRDELALFQYIGNPNSITWIRGYDRQSAFSTLCGGGFGTGAGCNVAELRGSRTAVASAELRFPVIRRLDLGVLPISLPPLDGLIFGDAGVAWSRDQQFSFSRPADYDLNRQRYVLRSYGAGLRLNLFGYALVRWDYAIPLDRRTADGKRAKGFWTWSLGPSF